MGGAYTRERGEGENRASVVCTLVTNLSWCISIFFGSLNCYNISLQFTGHTNNPIKSNSHLHTTHSEHEQGNESISLNIGLFDKVISALTFVL